MGYFLPYRQEKRVNYKGKIVTLRQIFTHKLLKIKFFLKQIINFIIYSNIWIALGAFALCLQTKWLLMRDLSLNFLDGFVFFSTLFLYTAHRIIGLQKFNVAAPPTRFSYLYQFKIFFYIWMTVAALASCILFFKLPQNVQWLTILPMLLSAGYALPLLPNKKRLRDLSYFKILLVALAWAWVTVVLPVVAHGLWYNLPMWLLFSERFCFIAAIAITFDIRDLMVDQRLQVKTIPFTLGIKNTKIVAVLMLILMIIFTLFNFKLDAYTFHNWLVLCLSAILTGFLIIFATINRSDYYFSGLLDGMIVLQAILILVLK